MNREKDVAAALGIVDRNGHICDTAPVHSEEIRLQSALARAYRYHGNHLRQTRCLTRLASTVVQADVEQPYFQSNDALAVAQALYEGADYTKAQDWAARAFNLAATYYQA